MASRHVPSPSSSLGGKRMVKYGGSSRKRPSAVATTRDAEPGSSKSKLSQMYDYPSSPESTHQSPKSKDSSAKTLKKTPLKKTPLPSHSKPSAIAAPPSTSRVSHLNKGLTRKRNHAVAFAGDLGQKARRDVPHDHQDGDRDKVDIEIPQNPKIVSYSPEPIDASRLTNHTKSAPIARSTDSSSTSAAPAKPANTKSTRRPRLIDALAAQRTSVASHDDDDDDNEGEREPFLGHEQTPNARSGLLSQDADRDIRTPDRRGTTTPANRKVRFTYSQSRRPISESQTPDVFDSPGRAPEDGLDPLLAEPLTIASPPTDAFAPDESDDEGDTQPAIKSVHELRRAGANNRFADEMDDLMARIGLPGSSSSSMRRNALCELVQKLQRKEFLRQFRDHASRDTVARNIGREEDVICGFALVSALLSFLHSGAAPNLLRQLAGEGVGKLLGLLLRVREDVVIVASQKELNMSRMSRSGVEGVKAILHDLPIWHGYESLDLSPRTTALQLMVLLSRCADATLLDQILLDSQRDIISVATWASEEGSHDKVDYALTVFTLETQSSAGVAPRLNLDGRHPTRIARLLSRALEHWPSGRPDLDSAILKLAINTTNTEAEAAAFGDSQLCTMLARRLAYLFAQLHGEIEAGRLDSNAYDELLLLLGVMINILEHCVPARKAVAEDAMASLMKLWLDNQESVSEADSVEKSKLSVAVGYLSVLLGYMCLAGRAREQFEHGIGSAALQRLRTSIQQFSRMYKAVDNKAQAMDILVQELRRVS